MTPKAMATLHEVLGPPGGRPSSPPRSFCCLPVSWPPGAPMKTAPLLVVVGSAKLLVNNGKFVCGGVVICGVLVEVEVKIGGIDSVVDCDRKVLDVLESDSPSVSDDVVDVVLELVVRAGGGEKTGGVEGGGGGKDVESSSSSSSSSALNLSSASSSSLSTSEAVPSTIASVRPQIASSSFCCLADTWTAARCTLLRRALGSRQDQHNGSSTCSKRATIFAPAQYLQQRTEPKGYHFFTNRLGAAAQA